MEKERRWEQRERGQREKKGGRKEEREGETKLKFLLRAQNFFSQTIL